MCIVYIFINVILLYRYIRFQFIFFFGGKINSNNRPPDRLLKQVYQFLYYMFDLLIKLYNMGKYNVVIIYDNESWLINY